MLKEQHIDVTPFLSLLDKPEQFELLYTVVEKAIFDSFGMIDTVINGKPPTITQSEIKRRFKICEKWVRVMRGECGFSLQRTLDMLPKALGYELLGAKFNPMDGSDHGWFPVASDLSRAVKL